MSNLGYQSTQKYLALPDILKTSFRFQEQEFNVRQAPASDFHRWLLWLSEWDFENVDTSTWPLHQRWRVINEMLRDGDLVLAEVENGFRLELPEEEKTSTMEDKASEAEDLEALAEQVAEQLV